MKRVHLLLLCCALMIGMTPVTTAAAKASSSASKTVTIKGPAKRQPGQTATLKGSAGGSKAVKIQRKKGGRWVAHRRAKVRKDGRYVAKVRPDTGRTKYRAVTTKGRSAKHVVHVPKPPTTPPPTDACGPRPPKADGSHWSCTFNDDFNGSTLDRTKWKPQTGNWSGTTERYACTRDDPRNIAVSGGSLQLTVLKGNDLTPCPGGLAPSQFSSGMVTTHHLFSQQYGRFEARIKSTATNVPGLQEAYWLWPDDRVSSTTTWPEAGEIDISETYSYYPKLSIPFLHYTKNDNGGPIPGVNTAWDCLADRGVFNTYTLIWGPNRLKILVNGKTCLVNTSGDPAFRKPYIMLLTQGLGRSRNAMTGDTRLPATMSVDYVRAWN